MPGSLAKSTAAPGTFRLVHGRWVLVGSEAFPRHRARECLEAWARGDAAFSSWLGSDTIAKLDRRRPIHRLCRGLMGLRSRSRRAFDLGLELTAAGVRTSLPLACLESRCLGITLGKAVLLQRVPGSNLREFILNRLAVAALEQGDEVKRRLWRAIAIEIARLHAARARQRDLKALNLIVDERPTGEILVTLIDLEGMASLGVEPDLRIRARDLSRLAASLLEPAVVAAGVSSADWRTFLGEYLEAWKHRPAATPELEALHALTHQWARRKLRRNERRGRVTA